MLLKKIKNKKKKKRLLEVKQVSKMSPTKKIFCLKFYFRANGLTKMKILGGIFRKSLKQDAYVRLLLEEVIENC